MANTLIIAANSDIGFATAKRLIAKGHTVHITGRTDSIMGRANELNASYSILDATKVDDVVALFESVQQQYGQIDGVVNCAGSLLLKSAHLTTQDEFKNVIDANLMTAFAVTHAAGKTMTQHGGSVVLISSAAALVGLASHEAIAAAKAGVIGLALAAAATYAPANIRFNVVAPGLIETKLTQGLTANPAARKFSEGMHPLGRIGAPDDVASAIEFFLSNENEWLTGQVLAVDGGLSHIRPRPKI